MLDGTSTDGPIPLLTVDPFSREFFENPHPIHGKIREAGPVVRLSRYGVLAAARCEQVYAMLNDQQTFSSARGVGLQDFAKEKAWRPKILVLETDPPFHNRTRQILSRVLSQAAMRRLRGQFETAADMMVDRLVERGRFDAIAELVEEYPLTVFPDAMGMSRENRRFLLPFRNMVFNSFGPANEFFRDAVEDAAPVLVWLQQQMQRDARAPGDQQETSVLLVEQNARYALETAARGYVLQTGTIIASGASS